MIRRKLGWFAVAAVLSVLVAASAPVIPQETDEASDAEAAPDSAVQRQEGEKTVETILRQQEEILTGQRFSYDPAGRRDPFRSLYEQLGLKKKGPRPKGAAGMLIAELDLTGIVRDSGGGDLAVVMGSDNKGYFLRVGDEVYDGTLISIDSKAGNVTFRQQVDDPRLIKPYRDVVKRLLPTEESADE